MNTRIVSIGLIGAVLLGSLGGCAKWRERRAARQAERAAERASERGLAEATDARETIPSGQLGLSMRVMTVNDSGFAAGRVLSQFVGEPLPFDNATIEAWRSAGLRWVAIPTDQVESLALRMPPVRPIQQQHNGQFGTWATLVRSPSIESGVPTGSGFVGPGKPRLIARAWLEPDLSSGALKSVLRVDLGVQIESQRRSAYEQFRPTSQSIADQGVIVDTLLSSFVADGSSALLLVAEDPSVDWDELPPILVSNPEEPADDGNLIAPSETGTEQGTETRTAGTSAGGTGLGPTAPRVRTLGERMLSSPTIPARDGRPAIPARKVLVILIPVTEGSVEGADS